MFQGETVIPVTMDLIEEGQGNFSQMHKFLSLIEGFLQRNAKDPTLC